MAYQGRIGRFPIPDSTIECGAMESAPPEPIASSFQPENSVKGDELGVFTTPVGRGDGTRGRRVVGDREISFGPSDLWVRL